MFRTTSLTTLALAACAAFAPSDLRAETTLCTPITALPAVITTQGVYCLHHDLATNVGSGAAISIATNNVTIDCNDRKIGGLGAGVTTRATGIHSWNRSNITVRGCSVRGFHVGIDVGGGSGHVVEDNRLEGNTFIGMSVRGDASLVRRNRILDTGGADYAPGWTMGIQTVGTVEITDNLIQGSTSAGDRNDAYGIEVRETHGATISGNRIIGFASESQLGIRLLSGTRNRIEGNWIALAGGWATHCDGDGKGGWVRDNVWVASMANRCIDMGGNLGIP